MIKLKDLLTEEWLTHKGKTMWFPAHTKPTMDMISMRDHIAMYPTQMEKMFGKQPISSFHVTAPDHLGKLGSIIGKKKSISSFTRANNDSPLAKGRGIQTGQGGIIFYMKGTLLAKRWMDFDTLPDKTGRRWIAGHYIAGDRQTFTKAYEKAGIPKKREKLFDKIYDIKKKYEEQWMADDEAMPYDKYKKNVEKESGSFINKFIKDFFDWQNKYIERNKAAIKKYLRTPEDKPTAWWNEVLIYDTKVIDAFVMTRVTKSAITGTRPHWEHPDGKPGSAQIEMLKYVPKNKITIGTPAQYRKWVTERQGKFDQISLS